MLTSGKQTLLTIIPVLELLVILFQNTTFFLFAVPFSIILKFSLSKYCLFLTGFGFSLSRSRVLRLVTTWVEIWKSLRI